MALTDDEKIAIIGESLFGLALGDIHRTLGCDYPNECIGETTLLGDGLPFLGAMIQCCVLIESAAHHDNPTSADGVAFEAFVQKFLPAKYNARALWQVMRCGMLHRVSVKCGVLTISLGGILRLLFNPIDESNSFDQISQSLGFIQSPPALLCA